MISTCFGSNENQFMLMLIEKTKTVKKHILSIIITMKYDGKGLVTGNSQTD